MLWAWLRNRWFRKASLGRQGEDWAARYLERLGYRILHRGHRLRAGELDLVALDGKVIVFVEVKTRRSADHGSPAEAVDRRKQARLTRAALAYLKCNGLLERPARFDVVSIVWSAEAREPEVRHYRAAFDARDFNGMYS